MKPVKSLYPVAKWFLRISILLFVYDAYFTNLGKFHLSLDFLINLAFVVFTVLLFVGGFMKTHQITVMSATVILGITILSMFLRYQAKFDFDATGIVVCGICLFFISVGNK